MASITLFDQCLTLLPDKACYWAKRDTLFVADTHFGKSAVFRREGIPLPEGSDQQDLHRLSRIIKHIKPQRLLILGDFFHGALPTTHPFFERFAQWRKQFKEMNVTVVAGNHDRYYEQGLHDTLWQDELYEDTLLLTHEPVYRPDYYTLSGHIHPCIVMGNRSDRLRLPIFWFQKHQGILPSFGSLTGGYTVKPSKYDQLWAAGEDDVIHIQ